MRRKIKFSDYFINPTTTASISPVSGHSTESHRRENYPSTPTNPSKNVSEEFVDAIRVKSLSKGRKIDDANDIFIIENIFSTAKYCTYFMALHSTGLFTICQRPKKCSSAPSKICFGAIFPTRKPPPWPTLEFHHLCGASNIPQYFRTHSVPLPANHMTHSEILERVTWVRVFFREARYCGEEKKLKEYHTIFDSRLPSDDLASFPLADDKDSVTNKLL